MRVPGGSRHYCWGGVIVKMIQKRLLLLSTFFTTASLPDPHGSGPDYRRPVVIVQSDLFNESRINTVIVAILTSNLNLAAAPGNVMIERESLDAFW